MTARSDRPVLPTRRESELAADASRSLSAIKDAERDLRVRLENGQMLTLPPVAADLLRHLLAEMSQGHAVTVLSVQSELTTQQAADHLNVSRPFLISLLESGKIRFRRVGTHRRVRLDDLEAFRETSDVARRAAMSELADQAQSLKMGY